MGAFLERWLVDRTAEPDETFDPTSFQFGQQQRLLDMAALAHTAVNIPRRLGGAATPDDLRTDKQFSRRLRNRLLSVLRTWGVHMADLDEHLMHADQESYTTKAQELDWPAYCSEYFQQQRELLNYLAVQGLKGGFRKDCNRLANMIFNETHQVFQLFERNFPDHAAAAIKSFDPMPE